MTKYCIKDEFKKLMENVSRILAMKILLIVLFWLRRHQIQKNSSILVNNVSATHVEIEQNTKDLKDELKKSIRKKCNLYMLTWMPSSILAFTLMIIITTFHLQLHLKMCSEMCLTTLIDLLTLLNLAGSFTWLLMGLPHVLKWTSSDQDVFKLLRKMKFMKLRNRG